MADPTKIVRRFHKADGVDEDTYEALCSVEIGETAKGDIQVKSVKVYAQSVEDAGGAALREFLRLRDLVTREGSHE